VKDAVHMNEERDKEREIKRKREERDIFALERRNFVLIRYSRKM